MSDLTMTRIATRVRRRRLARMATATLLALGSSLLGTGDATRAALVVTSSSGQVQFSVRNLAASSPGLPSFDPVTGALIVPGRGFPSLGSIVSPTQTFTGPLAPDGLFAEADPSRIGMPGQFGQAGVFEIAFGSGQGASLTQAGIFFDSNTFVQSSLATGVASVSVSQGTATFRNTGTTSISATPGMLLNATAALGQPASFVAGGLVGSILLPGATQAVRFADISFAFTNVINGIPGAVSGGGAGTTFTLLPSRDGNSARITGASLFNAPITLRPGESFTVTGTLTLISDPDSIVRISTDLPLLPPGVDVPDIGLFAGGIRVVPEPSSVLLTALGLASLALAARRRRPGDTPR